MTKQPTYKNSSGKTRWLVLARDRQSNKVNRVWGRKKTDPDTGQTVWKFKRRFKNPNPDAQPGWKCRLPKEASKQAKAWAETKGYACYRSSEQYPYLLIYNQLGAPHVGKKLNRTARDLQRYLRCGWQRSKKDQYHLYQNWLKGVPGYNRAAPCCSRGDLHSWETCQKSGPCKSNHCDPGGGGVASDTSVYRVGRDGAYVAIRAWSGGTKALNSHGLKALVSDEDWHCSPTGY